MQGTPPVIKKWSEMQGLAAVSINTGKKAGTLEDFYFAIQNNAVRALLIKTGMLGHRALLASSITAIGQDALTFANDEQLIKEESNRELSGLVLGRGLLAYRVLSEGGNMVGTIGNIFLDATNPSELRVTEFALAGGLLSYLSKNHPSFKADEVTRYGHDVIIIPDTVAQALQRH